MYAIFVGIKSHFLLDSIHEEKSFEVDPDGWSDILLPSVMVRLNDMAQEWSERGVYTHPQVKKPETEQLLGYAPGGSTAGELIDRLNGGFFAIICRENRHGEFHLWNSRWNAFYEFNHVERNLPKSFGVDRFHERGIYLEKYETRTLRTVSPVSWYVRTLGFPGTLLTWAWTGALDSAEKPIPELVRASSPKARKGGMHRFTLTADQKSRDCVSPDLLWTVPHLDALRKIGEIKVALKNIDRDADASVQ